MSLFPSRIHFGQITSNQMLLSVIDELRSNTLSKVSEIRVSKHLHGEASRCFVSVICLLTFVLCPLASGCDGLQQRRPPVPPAGDREQRGSDVLCRSHGSTGGEEEEEEEEGEGCPDHCLNYNVHFVIEPSTSLGFTSGRDHMDRTVGLCTSWNPDRL